LDGTATESGTDAFLSLIEMLEESKAFPAVYGLPCRPNVSNDKLELRDFAGV
jgi:hypothetical protein